MLTHFSVMRLKAIIMHHSFRAGDIGIGRPVFPQREFGSHHQYDETQQVEVSQGNSRLVAGCQQQSLHPYRYIFKGIDHFHDVGI